MPDVQIFENPAHMVQRLKVERARLQAERDQLRAIIVQAVEALPLLGGAAGLEIANEIMKALPAAVDVRDPSAQGGYTQAQPAHPQPARLPAPAQPAPTQHALPATTGGDVVMPMLPDGFPLDAIPPEFRAQAQRQGGRQGPPAPAPQSQAAARPAPRFGGPRAVQPPGAQSASEPYHQPGHPEAIIRPVIGLEDISFDGSNGKGGNVKIGKLAVGGPGNAHAPRAGAPTQANQPGKMTALQAAVAKARAGNG